MTELSELCHVTEETIRRDLDGGILASPSFSFVGPQAERTLETYHVNKAFISCKGIRLDRGLSESNEWQAIVKRQMLNMADHVIVLADSSKFGVQAFTHVGDLSQISELITDKAIDKDTLTGLEEQGIRVTRV